MSVDGRLLVCALSDCKVGDRLERACMAKGGGLFKTPEELRKMGWMPQDEASKLLGLPLGEMISWDYIESEQRASDGENWVHLLPEYRRQEVNSPPVTHQPSNPTPPKAQRPKPNVQRPTEPEWMTQEEARSYLGVHANT